MTKEEILKKGMNFNGAGESLSDSNWNVLVKYDSAIIAMEEYAKQEAIEFFKWYVTKTLDFIEYLQLVNPLVKSHEIEDKLKQFEGKSFDELYNLYLQSKK